MRGPKGATGVISRARTALGALSAVAALLGAMPVLAADTTVRVDLPAQKLSESLDALAAQSQIQMMYAGDSVRGLSAPALKGEYPVAEALRRLLAGSGLETRTSGDTYLIVKPQSINRLEAVTVTATRTENKAFDVPASVSVVTRQQIDDLQAKDIATVLRDLPGVTMGGGPRENGQLPTIRGYQGSDIILRVDDARRSLDASVGIFSPLYLDPNFVKQVDIVRGPSSAIYGGGGLGGVMAFRTIDADDVLAPGESVGGYAKAGYRSGDGSINSNLTGAAQTAGASVVASGTIRNYHNINNGAGTENIQNGTSQNGLMKVGYSPNELNDITVSYMRYFDGGIGFANPAFNDVWNASSLRYIERSQDEFSGRWDFRDDTKKTLDGKVFAYSTHLKQEIQDRANSAANNSTYEVTTYGGGVQNSSRFMAGPGHRLTYGLDGYRDELTNTSGGNANAINPDGTMLAGGGFVQDEIQLSNTWTLIPAVRFDSYKAEGGANPTNSSERLSPKLAIKWQALPAVGVFASYGEAFRAPTLTELYSSDNRSSSFQNFRASPTLKPEVSHTKEVGMTLALDNLLADSDSLRVKATAFDEHVDDLINQATVGTYARTSAPFGTGYVFQYQNVSNVHRWGGDVELDYRLGDWSFGAGYSRLRVNNNALLSQPDKLTTSVGYFVDEYLALRYAARFVAAQDYDTKVDTSGVPPQDRRRSGYAVHDIGASYDRDWYRVDFAVTNIFDKEYMTYGQSLQTSRIYEEGRSFNLNFTARF